ncbi:MAG: hypothetical protein GF330_02020 [Candidatus Eisenbacteria bacterium]|nr:hypothetical protein [Candidatus Eisenbacteria bacterium]
MLRPTLWVPMLLVAAVQLLALLFLLSFHHSALLPIALPVVRLLGGEAATHYPNLYFALPNMFFEINLFVTALVSSIAGGAGALLFARAYGIEGFARPWRAALRRAPALIAVGIFLVLLVYGVSRASGLVPREAILGDAFVRWGVRLGVLLVFIVIESLLAYATAWIVLMGEGPGAAVRDSVRVAGHTFPPTLLVVGVPALLFFPLSYLAGRVDLIAGKLSPEVMAGLVIAQILLGILLTFFVVGAVTRLFLWRVEAAR